MWKVACRAVVVARGLACGQYGQVRVPMPGATAQPAVLHHQLGNVEQMEMLSSYGSCFKENQGMIGLVVAWWDERGGNTSI